MSWLLEPRPREWTSQSLLERQLGTHGTVPFFGVVPLEEISLCTIESTLEPGLNPIGESLVTTATSEGSISSGFGPWDSFLE
jgi:hypothetical protein